MLCYANIPCCFAQARTDSLRSYTSGKDLFREYCSSCHSVHKEVTGPMLASITKKKREEWLLRFIRNSQEVIKSGDPYAVFLFKQYEHQIMPPFKNLTNHEIKDILFYIKRESISPEEELHPVSRGVEQANPTVMQGKDLFQKHCAYCHVIDKETDYAPALGSVMKRHPRNWLIPFIKNSTNVIQSGDPYAVDIFNAFNKKEMVPMEFLKEEEINAILEYIEFFSRSEYVTRDASETKADETYSNKETEAVTIKSNNTFTLIFIVLIVITGAVLIFFMLKYFFY
ncbi:MAG: cytochrome c [Cytophagales bacterium]|nr:cytochrome c [Cytophaga sp.]